MQFDQAIVASSLAKRQLLESRVQVLAAVEAMADFEGFLDEYHRAVDLSDELDELIKAIEVKTQAIGHRVKDMEESSMTAE